MCNVQFTQARLLWFKVSVMLLTLFHSISSLCCHLKVFAFIMAKILFFVIFVYCSCSIYLYIVYFIACIFFRFFFTSLIYFTLFSTYFIASNLLYFIISNIQRLVVSFWDICDTIVRVVFAGKFCIKTIFTVHNLYSDMLMHAGVKIANTILCKTIVLYRFQLSNTVLYISDDLLCMRAKNWENSSFSFRDKFVF